MGFLKARGYSRDQSLVRLLWLVLYADRPNLKIATHFSRISAKLTVKRISDEGFDLSIPCESWAHPASTLHQIYKLEGLAYKKNAKNIERTIAALSRTEIAINVIPAVLSLSGFVEALTGC